MSTAPQPTRAAPWSEGLWQRRGVYETFLWHGDWPTGWPLHVARCQRGLRAWGLDLVSEAELRSAVQSALVGQEGLPVRVRISAFGAASSGPAVELLVQCRRLLPEERDASPARVVIAPGGRDPRSPLAGSKRLGIAPDLALRDAARLTGADDVVLCSVAGLLAEASTSNLLFGLDDQEIATPGAQAGPVQGTTLEQVRRALALGGESVVDVALPRAEAARVRWALLLNAVVGARVVSHLEARTLQPPPAHIVQLAKRLTGAAR